ncbi:hypothetical protein OOK31_36120 [Streptomyces sp. NBC_00249]|uniref:hypothetical protein n=1 Tax=Streptomyces sp. NBC_00249 TaxID=2975690 RepID=UPI0022531D53|nr:hypothetical protein [Streptomyces sp. NBC_00249]MCX5199249.1 hypothetical protein [Streptomyces sp. NBC_00249]
MDETSAALATARWPLAASGETDWLRELADDDGLTGFMPPPHPDAAWVLHSMYEHEVGPTDMSYATYNQAVLMAGGTGPEIIPGLDPAEVFGGTQGEHPGPRWRRLRWAELSQRIGDPLVPEGKFPCYTAFPSLRQPVGWPVGICAPSEGYVDRADWNRLVDLLTEHSPQGPDTPCLAYWTPLVLGAEDFDNLSVRSGRLGDAKALYDHPEPEWSPSNLWARDRSWVLCTDYDLWATKVAGPAPLIEALLADKDVEAVRLPWIP